MKKQKYQDYIDKLDNLNKTINEIIEELEVLSNIEIKNAECPKNGDNYWYINDYASVVCSEWGDDYIDNYRKDFLRIFRTEEECQRYLEIQKAFKEESKKFKPDWENNSQDKYYIYYIYIHDEIQISYTSISREDASDYFESEEVLESLIERFGEEDIKKYYLGIEE